MPGTLYPAENENDCTLYTYSLARENTLTYMVHNVNVDIQYIYREISLLSYLTFMTLLGKIQHLGKILT